MRWFDSIRTATPEMAIVVRLLLAAALGNWGFRVPLAALGATALRLDLVWVWGALFFDHLARAIWLGIAFQRGRWRGKRLPLPTRHGA